jgi:hypothetical protein
MVTLRQLTFGSYGHTLNRRQAISPDGDWAIYDTRNDDTHIARTDRIEMVHIDTGNIRLVYQTPLQSEFGPGVGAAAFHPCEHKVIFIHGLSNCSPDHPYSAARRFGAIVDCDIPGRLIHAESRRSCANPNEAFSDSVSRGGTHAHSWNQRGWISCTYNDAHSEQLAKLNPQHRDARTIGCMMPSVRPTADLSANDSENFAGAFDFFIAANVVQHAQSGTDQIESAVEECWLGSKPAIAFQGAIRDQLGNLHQEIFVSDIALTDGASPCFSQRRITYTLDRKFPGLQGPRCWLAASPDGQFIYFLARDERGTIQLFRVDSNGSAEIEQITDLACSIEGQITLDPMGQRCSFLCDQKITIVDIPSGQVVFQSERSTCALSGAVHFASHGRLLCNGNVDCNSDSYLQILCCQCPL